MIYGRPRHTLEETCTVFLSNYRNTSGSFGERGILGNTSSSSIIRRETTGNRYFKCLLRILLWTSPLAQKICGRQLEKLVAKTPCIRRLAPIKFELTTQDLAGEKNRPVQASNAFSEGNALKTDSFS